MVGKRRFGRVRKLPSGRWQARYLGPDGVDRPAPETFRTKTEAEQWLAKIEVEILADDWLDPDVGQVSLKEYGQAWIDERPKLRPKSRQGYNSLLMKHIVPYLGSMAVNEIKAPRVRRWRKQLTDAGVGEATIARAYQLLKSIFNTAVDDEVIRRTPCRIDGGAVNDTPERPVLTMTQIFTVAGEIPLRFRMLVLLATFASLRWGELVALERQDIDLDSCTIRITKSAVELDGGTILIGPPKSRAGVRVVSFPELLKPDLQQHLDDYVPDQPIARVFTSWEDGTLRRANFQKIWAEARSNVGLPAVHFHDLRHTGNTLASQTGASLKELMQRMGHSTVRAAIIYQHNTPGRDQKIAQALDDLIAELTIKKEEEEPPTE